jgi:hypothetical protein
MEPSNLGTVNMGRSKLKISYGGIFTGFILGLIVSVGAQTPSQFIPNTVIDPTAVNAQFGKKVDVSNGVLNNPTLNGTPIFGNLSAWQSTLGLSGSTTNTAMPSLAANSCGQNATVGIGSTNSHGYINIGTNATGCQLLFAAPAATSYRSCVFSDRAGGAVPPYQVVLANATITASGLSGTILDYHCDGA